MSNLHAHMTQEEIKAYRLAVLEIAKQPDCQEMFKKKYAEAETAYDEILKCKRSCLDSISDIEDPEIANNTKIAVISYLDSELAKIQKEKNKWDYRWRSVNPKKNRQTFDIEVIKLTPITEVLEARGFKRHHNKTFICPFHEEKTPSFKVFSDNRAHCFGCQFHGDVISVVMELDQCSFIEACKSLSH